MKEKYAIFLLLIPVIIFSFLFSKNRGGSERYYTKKSLSTRGIEITKSENEIGDEACSHLSYCKQSKPSESLKPPVPSVPGPLPVVGLFSALAYSRKLRQRIKNEHP
jgi:hypothetical protein